MTITSEELREFATQYFQQHHDLDLEALVDWREWFFKPGMPKGTRELLDDSLLNEVNALLRVWTAEGDHEPTAGDIDGWTCVQTTILLKQLLTEHVAALTVKTLDQMDQLYRFSDSRNAEIKFNWQRLCIAVGKADVLPSVIDFLKVCLCFPVDFRCWSSCIPFLTFIMTAIMFAGTRTPEVHPSSVQRLVEGRQRHSISHSRH